jgi:hypothetical protein
MSNKDNRMMFVSLILQGLDEPETLAKLFGLSDKSVEQTKNDLAKKIRNPEAKSARKLNKSDLLSAQLMALMDYAGFDLSSVEIGPDSLIKRIQGPGGQFVGFERQSSEVIEDSSMTIKGVFNLSNEDRHKVIAACKLIKY